MEPTVPATPTMPVVPATAKPASGTPAKGAKIAPGKESVGDEKSNLDFAALLIGSSLAAGAAAVATVPSEKLLAEGGQKIVSADGSAQPVKENGALAAVKASIVAKSPAGTGSQPQAGVDEKKEIPTVASDTKEVPAASASVAEDQVNVSPLAAKSGPVRRAVGQGIMNEKFPEGWEVLLEDKPTANAAAPATAAGKKSNAVTSQKVVDPAESETKKSQLPETAAARPVSRLEKTSDVKPVAAKKESLAAANPSQDPAQTQSEDDATAATVAKNGSWAESAAASVPAMKTASEGVHSTPTAFATAKALSSMNELQKHMVVQDFVQTTVHKISGDSETLSVDLHPPELGHVKVVLESQGDHVNACLMTQDKEVGEMFKQNMGSIRQSLEDAGIKLGGLSVEIRQQFQPGNGEQLQQQEGLKFGTASPSGNTVATPTGKWAAFSEGKVDMLV